MAHSAQEKRIGLFTRRQSTVFHGTLLLSLAVALTIVCWNAKPYFGLSISAQNDVFCVGWVQPGSLAWDDGIRPGDVVLAVDGSKPESGEQAETANELSVASTENSKLVNLERVEPPSFSPLIKDILLIIGLFFAGVGFLVYLRATSRQAAEVFFWLCLSAAIALVVAPITNKSISWALAIEFASTKFAYTFFFMFFLVFPIPHVRWLNRKPSFYLLLLTPALLLSIAYVLIDVFSPTSYVWLQSLGNVVLVIGLLGGLLLLLRSYYLAKSPVIREQIRFIVVGTTIAVLPLVLISIMPKALTGDYILRPELAVLSVVALPLSFAYAIMRHQLMGIRRLIHRSLVYFLFSALLIVTYLFLYTVGRTLFADMSQTQISSFLAISIVLAVGLLHPQAEKAIRNTVDRLLYKDTYDYKETLYELNSKLVLSSDTEDLSRRVLASLIGAVNLKFAGLLADVGNRSVIVESMKGLPTSVVLQSSEALVLNKLAEKHLHEEIVFSDDGASILLVPLVSGDLCRGFLILGPKQTEEPFREEDRFLLRTFAGHIATYIEKLQLIEELKKQLKELEHSRILLSKQQEELIEWNSRLLLAQEQERSNIAQYLHDEPLQKVLMLAREVRDASDEDKRQRTLSLAREVASDLRDFSARLHPSMIDDLGLVPTLHWLVSEVRNHESPKIVLNIEDVQEEDRFEPEVELTIYRLAQEAVTNSLKHAEASTVNIALKRNNDTLSLRIRDDGKGFNTKSTLSSIKRGHLGLVGMQERLRQVGGSFKIMSSPGDGTVVEAEVPTSRPIHSGGLYGSRQ